MRILMICPSFHPAVGGVETHVLRVADCLSAAGHQVTVLTHADFPCEERLLNLRVCRIRKTGWWAAWRAARPHIAAADVVHCHDPYSFLHFYAPSCYLPPRRPVFITFHGYEGYPIPQEAIRRRRFARRRVRDAICIGDFICRRYRVSCFAVSYGGVVPVAEVPPLPLQPSAVFVGRLAQDTSIMTYLEALWLLRRDYGQEVPLAVIGDGPLRSLAEKFVMDHRIRAEFHGIVPDPMPFLARAHFAFVSGYLAIWQALASQRLVFSVYDNPVKREYLFGFPEAEAVLNLAKDGPEVARQLARYLGDLARGDSRRQRGAQLAAENTWERVADLYLDMYGAHGLA
jgi:glycosyltransferase involved in cell wall biosynthesis